MEFVWLLVGLVAGGVGGVIAMRVRGQGALKRARREAAQILSDAERNAAALAKEAKTSIKEQEISLREKIEKEASV